MDTHTLALSVINDSATHANRVKNYLAMTKREFAAYALELVNAKAKEETRKFNVRYKPRDIDAALADLIEHHKNAHRDAVGTEEQEAEGMRAVIYLESLEGNIVSPREARITWAELPDEDRVSTLTRYATHQSVNADAPATAPARELVMG